MITICVCDDSTVSITQLKILLTKFQDDYHVLFDLHTYVTGKNLLSDLSQGIRFQIYLLDIILPEESGIEIARQIRNYDTQACILFLTASPEYALDAFSVAALDYLIKPVQYDALVQALFRILTPHKNTQAEDKLSLKLGEAVHNIPYQSICYLEIQKKKITLVLNNGKTLIVDQSLIPLDEILSKQDAFLRIHRSYIINMKYIREISSKGVKLIPNYQLPISLSYIAKLKSSYFTYLEQN